MAERRHRFANEKHEYHDPGLLIGCWFNERARRETDFREYVDLYNKGQLPVQMMENYVQSLNRKANCTETLDGRLINGCRVGLAWRDSDEFLSALPKSVMSDGSYQLPCLATVATRPVKNEVPARSAFAIFREDQRVPDNVTLMHNECLMFCLIGTPLRLFLNKDVLDPMPLPDVNWIERSSSHALWKVSGKDVYIAVNSPVVVRHVSSGQRLTLDRKPIQSLLGVEHKVACTFEKHEPDTWRIVAPCQLFVSDAENYHWRRRNIWDVLNQRY